MVIAGLLERATHPRLPDARRHVGVALELHEIHERLSVGRARRRGIDDALCEPASTRHVGGLEVALGGIEAPAYPGVDVGGRGETDAELEELGGGLECAAPRRIVSGIRQR